MTSADGMNLRADAWVVSRSRSMNDPRCRMRPVNPRRRRELQLHVDALDALAVTPGPALVQLVQREREVHRARSAGARELEREQRAEREGLGEELELRDRDVARRPPSIAPGGFGCRQQAARAVVYSSPITCWSGRGAGRSPRARTGRTTGWPFEVALGEAAEGLRGREEQVGVQLARLDPRRPLAQELERRLRRSGGPTRDREVAPGDRQLRRRDRLLELEVLAPAR